MRFAGLRRGAGCGLVAALCLAASPLVSHSHSVATVSADDTPNLRTLANRLSENAPIKEIEADSLTTPIQVQVERALARMGSLAEIDEDVIEACLRTPNEDHPCVIQKRIYGQDKLHHKKEFIAIETIREAAIFMQESPDLQRETSAPRYVQQLTELMAHHFWTMANQFGESQADFEAHFKQLLAMEIDFSLSQTRETEADATAAKSEGL